MYKQLYARLSTSTPAASSVSTAARHRLRSPVLTTRTYTNLRPTRLSHSHGHAIPALSVTATFPRTSAYVCFSPLKQNGVAFFASSARTQAAAPAVAENALGDEGGPVHVSEEILENSPLVDVKKVLVVGSGGLSIGQAGEFDYSGELVSTLLLALLNLW